MEDDTSLRCGSDTSREISSEACVKSQFPNADTARNAADDPDTGSLPSIPVIVPQAMQTAINAVFHSWNHYYSPYRGWGGAPDNTSAKSTIVSPHLNDSGVNVTDAEPPLPANGTVNRSVEGESTPVPPIATTPPRV